MTTETFTVAGMSCDHCVHAVTEELGELDGVASVDVDLHPNADSPVTVTSNAPLDREQVRVAIDEAGYDLK